LSANTFGGGRRTIPRAMVNGFNANRFRL
jgi:hypothetical protein